MRGVSAPGGVYCGGCTWSRGGVSAPKGGVPGPGGVSAPGGVCSRGVYLVPGGSAPGGCLVASLFHNCGWVDFPVDKLILKVTRPLYKCLKILNKRPAELLFPPRVDVLR